MIEMVQTYRLKLPETIGTYAAAIILAVSIAFAFVYDLNYGSLPGDLLWRLAGAVPLGMGVYILVATARGRIVFRGNSLLYTLTLPRQRIPWTILDRVVIQRTPYNLVTLHYTPPGKRQKTLQIPVERFRGTDRIIRTLIQLAREEDIELQFV